MRQPELVADTLRILAEQGIEGEVKPLTRTGHFKIIFINNFGQRQTIVVSRTPSSRNARHKNRGVLRRLLRNRNGHNGGRRGVA